MPEDSPQRDQESANAAALYTREVAQATAEDVMRPYQRRVLRVFIALFLVILAVGAYDRKNADDSRSAIVKSGDALAVDGCNRDYVAIDGLRDQLEISVVRTRNLARKGVLPKGEARRQVKFSLRFLKVYKLPDCRKAAEVLTANPDGTPQVGQARYPDDPQQLKAEASEARRYGERVNVP